MGVSLGFTARVEPSWGGQAQSGAAALWGRQTMAGMAPGGVASGNRLDGEVGYGLPVGGRLVGTPRVGIGASEHGRAYRLGYGLTVAQGGALHVELGVDAHRRRESEAGRRGHGGARPGRAALVRRGADGRLEWSGGNARHTVGRQRGPSVASKTEIPV